MRLTRIGRCATFLACAFLVAGCGDEGAAKDAVKRMLNDPDSAKFSDLRPGTTKGDTCGFVNAKNRMGGYVRAAPFFYQNTNQSVAILKPVERSDFRSLWIAIQAKNFADDYSKLAF